MNTRLLCIAISCLQISSLLNGSHMQNEVRDTSRHTNPRNISDSDNASSASSLRSPTRASHRPNHITFSGDCQDLYILPHARIDEFDKPETRESRNSHETKRS